MIQGYIAVSIDGYIASTEGSVAFLDQFQDIDCGYDEFIKTIDVIVMGRKSYQSILAFDIDWPYPAQKTWVLSTQTDLPLAHNSINIWSEGIHTLIDRLRNNSHENTWLLGGGELISSALAAGLVDQLELYEMPITLGSGIPLFSRKQSGKLNFKQLSVTVIQGTVLKKCYLF